MTLKDFVQNPARLDLSKNEYEQVHCKKCGLALQETITGKKPIPGGSACADCYYELIGEAIEEHPIASGGNRRG